RLQGDGIYTGLLVKIFSYLLAVRLKSQREYSKLSIVQIMRKIKVSSPKSRVAKYFFNACNIAQFIRIYAS
ncbi:MAG: hypothetical protein D3920_17200, partial [Candidatus Electrothrix sp. AW2]|nr:hypothetical protein [Candidatus Electrothrix gigas]